MNHMLPEGLHPQPEGYTREELLLAMQQRRVLHRPDGGQCHQRGLRTEH